jgi:hypothetical protein
VSGVPWLKTTDSGLDDWIYCTSLQLQPIITAHNQWLSKTRSIPSWTTRGFCSTVTDLVLIYESATSSTFIVRWLTLHSWTMNSLTTELRPTAPFRMNSELTIITLGRNEYVTMSYSSYVILFLSVAAVTCVSKPLASNGLFRLVTTETCVSEPLASNGLFCFSGVI